MVSWRNIILDSAWKGTLGIIKLKITDLENQQANL